MSLSTLPQGVKSIDSALVINYQAFSCKNSDGLVTVAGGDTHFDALVDLYGERTEFAIDRTGHIALYNGRPVLLNEINGDFKGASERVIGSNIAHMVDPTIPLTYPIYNCASSLLATDYIVTSIDVRDKSFYKDNPDALEGFVLGSLLAHVFNSKPPKYILDLITNKYIPLGLNVDLNSVRKDLKALEYNAFPVSYLNDLSRLETLQDVASRIALVSDLIPSETFNGAFYVINKLGREALSQGIKRRMKSLPEIVNAYIRLYKFL